ncbi:3-phosphoshikimate 1-carboxyvinyltransferase [Candidatus Peregrinibacteria bacterium]|nr:MAG: 3-phosphoshikimate 1-carboxyvinyltransferase [Candidatus Peregrinibacteria bacterium]
MEEVRKIEPFSHGAFGTVYIPGSKSLTNRALLLCALADGKSELHFPLLSEDSELMREALRKIGIDIQIQNDVWEIHGTGGKFVSGNHELFVGNAGTVARFLSAAMGLNSGTVRISGKPRMHERPLKDLLDALKDIGVDIISENENGCLPVIISGAGKIAGGTAGISGDTSSQFLSALLLVGAKTEMGIRIQVRPPLVSRPYLSMTIALLQQFGVKVISHSGFEFSVEPQNIQPISLDIEGDASSAAHVFSLAVAAGGNVTISNFPYPSLQGDARFLDILEKFGAKVERTLSGVTVKRIEELRPLGEIDMEDMPDVALAAATLAPLAQGKTKITGLSTLRKKECDRLEALRLNLEKMNVAVQTSEDSITIVGNPKTMIGAKIETFDDHRIAMSFSALGTRISGMTICDPKCVGKTFPEFWNVFESLRAT